MPSAKHRSPLELVKEFHLTYGQPIRSVLDINVPELSLRIGILDEEIGEYNDALIEKDHVELVDALADIIYVSAGFLLTIGSQETGPQQQANLPQESFQEKNIPWLELKEYGRKLTKLNAYVHQSSDASITQFFLTDIMSLCYEAAALMNVDLDQVLLEVQSSNMSKLGEDGTPVYRYDGKVLKGPNFFPPNIARILQEQSQIDIVDKEN